jgi:hypothetical protein
MFENHTPKIKGYISNARSASKFEVGFEYTASHEGTLVPNDVRMPKQSFHTNVQDVYTS